MLHLTRCKGEAICIGDDTTMIVLGIEHNYVRLGFKAPIEVAIDREEIWMRKRGEQVLHVELDVGHADIQQVTD